MLDPIRIQVTAYYFIRIIYGREKEIQPIAK